MREHEAKAFLTNFGLKIFHTLGDAETAEYASSLLGKRRESFTSLQQKPDRTWGEEVFGTDAVTGTFSESYQPVLQPVEFMSGLRSGGPPGFVVDGICIRNGVPFRCGENFQRFTFSQR